MQTIQADLARFPEADKITRVGFSVKATQPLLYCLMIKVHQDSYRHSLDLLCWTPMDLV